jgi:hypothetical protein
LLIGTSSVASFPDDDDDESSSPLFLSDDDFDDANNDKSVLLFLLRFRLCSPPEIIILISNCLFLFPILNVFSLWCKCRRSEEAKRPSRRLRDEEEDKEDKEEVRRISRTKGGLGDIFRRRLNGLFFISKRSEVKKFEDVFRLI